MAITSANCDTINIKIDNININVAENINLLQSLSNVLQSNKQVLYEIELTKDTQSALNNRNSENITNNSIVDQSAISELSKLVYTDEIDYFESKSNPKLSSICSLLKQNDFSKQTVTKEDYKYFMTAIKSLNAKQINVYERCRS